MNIFDFVFFIASITLLYLSYRQGWADGRLNLLSKFKKDLDLEKPKPKPLVKRRTFLQEIKDYLSSF